jgi:tRNA dimethylallyltransferase
LDGKDINELYEILAQNDPVKAASLNASDIKNKRRLMRAIEICLWKNGKTEFKKPVKSEKDYLFIGLIADKELSKSLVEKRVFERFYSGFQEEVERLIISGVSWDSQSMQSLGYRQIKDYFFGKNTKSEFLKNWVASELKYIKRQNTWFKKEKRIMWFNVKSPNLYTKVENTVIKWHNGEGLNI